MSTIKSEKRLFAGFVIYALTVLLVFLGSGAVFQVSEGREGVVVNEILNSGELVLPLRNGHIVPSKPILFHWLGALGAEILGEYDEFALRLPSALAALALILVLYNFLRSVSGSPGVGVFGGAVLLSSYGYLRLALDGRVDMLFCALSTSAILLWLKDYIGAGRVASRGILLCAALTGLAVLAKGPLGLALTALVLSAVVVGHEGIKALRQFFRPEWVLALLIPLPWYLAAAQYGSQAFVGRQLIFENVGRFVGSEGITVKSPFYYLPHFFVQGLPWSLIFVLYIYFLVRGYFSVKGAPQKANPFLPEDQKLRLTIKSCLIWLVAVFAFLSISAGKRRGYLLLLLPAMSVVISARFYATWQRLERDGTIERVRMLLGYEVFSWGLAAFSVVFAVLFGCGFFLATDLTSLSTISPLVVRTVEAAKVAIDGEELKFLFVVLVFFPASVWLWVSAYRKKLLINALVALIVFVQGVQLLVIGSTMNLKGITHSYKNFAFLLRERIPDEVKLNFVKTVKDESFDGLFFYLNRHVNMIDPLTIPSAQGLYIARESWYGRQSPEWRARTTPLYKGGRLADEPGEHLLVFSLR